MKNFPIRGKKWISPFLFYAFSNLLFSQIMVHPSNKEAYIGNSVEFEVEHNGDALVQWEKNGTPIPGAYGEILLLEGIDIDDAGLYRAKVEFADSVTYSRSASLVVHRLMAGQQSRLVYDIPISGHFLDREPPESGVSFRNHLYYRRYLPSGSYQLWTCDGSRAGDLAFLKPSEQVLGLVQESWHVDHDDERMFFQATPKDSFERWLWVTDGEGIPTPLVSLGFGSTRGGIVDGDLYFEGADGGLWISNGTVLGTHRISTTSRAKDFVGAAGKVFFLSSSKLWITDGTEEGTVNVRDVDANNVIDVDQLFEFNEQVYFCRRSRLYRTDGRPGHTVEVSPITKTVLGLVGSIGNSLYVVINNPGYGPILEKLNPDDEWSELSNSDAPEGPMSASDTAVVSGRRFYYNSTGWLYSSDGTASGTYTLRSEYGQARQMVPHNQKLFFAGHTDGIGLEPWVSDGTPEGTRLIRDIFSGASSSIQSSPATGFMASVGRRVVFSAQDIHGCGLWATDGTSIGTYRLSSPSDQVSGDNEISSVGSAGGKFFFRLETPFDWLYVTDGSEGEVRRVANDPFQPGEESSASVGDRLIYTRDGRLTVSDGSVEGSIILMPGSASVSKVVAGQDALVAWFDSWQSGLKGIWKTDGSVGGTSEVFASDSLPGVGYRNLGITPDGKFLFFARGNNEAPRDFFYESWLHNVVTGATFKLADLESINSRLEITDLHLFGDRYWFVGKNHSGETKLFSTAGVPNDVAEVKLLDPDGSEFGEMVVLAGGFYFVVGDRLWFSDGTTTGTLIIGVFEDARVLTAVDEKCFFRAGRRPDQNELWVADGITNTTRLLRDDKVEGSDGMAAFNGLLYFAAVEPNTGEEVWVSDGTIEGTRLFMDAKSGSAGALPSGFHVSGDQLFWNQDDGVHGRELWVLDPKGKIIFTSEPRSRLISRGSNVELRIVAEGQGLSYEWFLGFKGDESNPVGTGTSLILGPVNESGVYWCKVSNDWETVLSSEVGIRVLTGFESWLQSYDASDEVVGANPNRDQDEDGRSDFAEYAFGGNPHSPDIQADFSTAFELEEEGEVVVARVAHRNDPDLDFQLQKSTDLEVWEDVEGASAIGSPTIMDSGLSSWTYWLGYRDDFSGNVFFRIHVEQAN